MNQKNHLMQTEKLLIKDLRNEPGDYFLKMEVMPGEIKGVLIEFFGMKGSVETEGGQQTDNYDVLFFVEGKAVLEIGGKEFKPGKYFIARIPLNEKYNICANEGEQSHFLRIRKYLDKDDLKVISENKEEHSDLFVKSLDDSPVYIEDILSGKSRNRMILPEGKVPRFCMGTVETEGPDSVAEHEHPMLDQLFLGMKGCRGRCRANGESAPILENMILHVPLGSKHSVSVADGDRLDYIWFDFFFKLEDQKYMNEQHHIVEE